MPLRRPRVFVPWSDSFCRVLALLFVLAAAGLHIFYLAHNCPLDLAPDEAHYWDWSRHLDWSYYSKGPLVAYLIRAGCELAGQTSRDLTGSLILAIRLPAVLCGSLLLVGLYVLTKQSYGRDRLALAVVAIALTQPMIAVGSSLMTIDAPYTCCWIWALVLTHHGVFRGSRWAWWAAGLAVGLGILAKYTMVLFVPSLGLFLLATPAFRGELRRPGFWTLTLVAALSCIPIVVWNAHHGWISLQHLKALAGFGHEHLVEPSSGPRFYWLGPLAYLGGQCALLLVFWFCAWAAAIYVHRPGVEHDGRLLYLWWLSLPMFLWFLAFSVKTGGGEVNWPVTAYLSGLVLAAGWLERQLQSPVVWYRRWTTANFALACALGIAVTLTMHHSEWLHPVMARLAGPATVDNPLPLRRLDPTCRLRGWRPTLAPAVDAALSALRDEGTDPVLAGGTWILPGELGFYCDGHPQAYTLGTLLGDRHSQYDLWENPVSDSRAFLGKTFLFVGDLPKNSAVRDCFDTIEPSHQVWHYEQGRPISFWTLTVCRGYKGPPEVKVRGKF